MDERLHAHAERYAAGHQGRHPFTDCRIPAGGIVIWGADEDWHIEHAITALTESMRLCMARYDVEWPDLGIDAVRDELAYWITPGFPAEEPVPGSSVWPAPTGPYAASWHRLFREADTDAVLLAAARVEEVLGLLLGEADCRHPESPTVFGCVLREFRPAGSPAFFGVVVDQCRNRAS
ncbi:hypothetical protein ACFVU3_26865 [Streptomyces sp. NPDC058052]|uniref:hypothetical protein n=1 Tax=Streptomyces sp. NPDC058052 TaxID=3346316 RepID=UPI0036E5C638